MVRIVSIHAPAANPGKLTVAPVHLELGGILDRDPAEDLIIYRDQRGDPPADDVIQDGIKKADRFFFHPRMNRLTARVSD